MLLLGPLGTRPDIWTPFVQALPPGTKVFIPPLEGTLDEQREQLQRYRDKKEVRRTDVLAVGTGAMLAATAPHLGRVALLAPVYKIPRLFRKPITCEPIADAVLLDARPDAFIAQPSAVVAALQEKGML